LEKASSKPIEDVFSDLQTSPEGLSRQEAKLRLKKFGYNMLSEKRQIPFIWKFIKHLRDLFGILVIVAAGLSYLSGSPELGTIILAVVFVNIFVSMFQDPALKKRWQR
jgi:Ca2+-transporting ATPase